MVRVVRTIPPSQLRLLVFDLDGTLIDSRRDLIDAVNATLTGLGLPEQHDDRIASYIGNGAAKLVERALAADKADPALAPAALEAFLDFYREHKLDNTVPYPGVLEQLALLRETLDVPMAVLTNKPVRASEQICEGLRLSPFFFRIYGGNSFPTKKPDPEGLLALMAEADARPNQTVMIGDSDVDLYTARAAGAWALGCRYGLSPHTVSAMEERGRVDIVVDQPSEWCDALGVSTNSGARSARGF